MANVLIGGGTGMIGMRLSELLTAKGYKVAHLSRTKNLDAKFPAYQWDVKAGIVDEEAIKKADYILNLAGAGIADRPWTSARKKLIIDSRVNSTRLLKNAIEKYNPNLKAYISASAIGIYGDRGDEKLTETSSDGSKEFLVESVQAWEAAIKEIEATKIRTAALRIGLVLSTKGGALPKLALPAKMNVGGYFADGQQWYAWVHIDDVCRMFIHLIENESLKGVFNGTAPNPTRNKEFTKQVGDALGKNLILIPGPAFALKLGLGEMASTVLNSTRVLPTRMEASGFEHKYETLLPALKDLFEREV